MYAGDVINTAELLQLFYGELPVIHACLLVRLS